MNGGSGLRVPFVNMAVHMQALYVEAELGACWIWMRSDPYFAARLLLE